MRHRAGAVRKPTRRKRATSMLRKGIEGALRGTLPRLSHRARSLASEVNFLKARRLPSSINSYLRGRFRPKPAIPPVSGHAPSQRF